MLDRHRLKQRRIQLNYTLQDVAEKIGLTKATVQKYESGYIGDMVTTLLETFAKALDCTPAYLMGWTDDPHDSPANKDNASFPLPAQEQKHIEVYRKLNAEGKERVDTYTNDLADNPKYTVQEPTPLRLHTKHDIAPQTFVNEDGEEMVILPVVARGGNSKPVILTKKAYEEANKEFADIFDNDDDEEIIPLDED